MFCRRGLEWLPSPGPSRMARHVPLGATIPQPHGTSPEPASPVSLTHPSCLPGITETQAAGLSFLCCLPGTVVPPALQGRLRGCTLEWRGWGGGFTTMRAEHVCVQLCIHVCMRIDGGGSVVKNLPAVQETQVQSLGRKDSLEGEMAIHSGILACTILQIEEPGGLQSMGSQRVGHN